MALTATSTENRSDTSATSAAIVSSSEMTTCLYMCYATKDGGIGRHQCVCRAVAARLTLFFFDGTSRR